MHYSTAGSKTSVKDNYLQFAAQEIIGWHRLNKTTRFRLNEHLNRLKDGVKQYLYTDIHISHIKTYIFRSIYVKTVYQPGLGPCTNNINNM